MPNKTKNKNQAKGRKQNKNCDKNVKQVVVYRDRPQKDTTLGTIGRLAGNGVSKFFGWGDYKLDTNSMWDMREQMPYMHSTNRSIRFRNREYITDINSWTAFAANIWPYKFAINPGLPESFPFLATIASNFQEYKFHGLVFEYRSNSADALNSTDTRLGYIAMSCAYRADAPAPTDKLSMLNEQWSVETKPSKDVFLPIECNPAEKPMQVQYVRTGELATTADKKFYDLGTTYLRAVTPQAAVNALGELWVSYDVELFKPSLLSGGAGTLNNTLGQAHYEASTGVTNAAPFGTNSTAKYDNIGLIVTSTSITLPVGVAGNFFFIFEVAGGSTASMGVTWTLVNLTQPTSQVGAATTWGAGIATANQFVYATSFEIVDPSLKASITLSSATLPTTATLSAFAISALNDSVNNYL